MSKTFLSPDSHIHIIARALLLQGENIVLCRLKGGDYFFLPGGHVEDGEPARAALVRELHEELGPGDYTVSSFVGMCENIFPAKEDQMKHEVSFVFRVAVPENVTVVSQEEHLEFVSMPQGDLASRDLRPAELKRAIIQWLADGKPFFKENA